MSAPDKLRHSILRMALVSQEGHVPSSLSILDIVWQIYDSGLVTPSGESKFVLSKGHGCLALYAALAELNYFPEGWLAQFASSESRLGGHPDRTLVPGIEASTGSLGHGMPFAVGIAYGQRIRRTGGRTFVLIGDGEANEGSVWEAAMVASHHQLSNLTCVVDDNQSSTRAIDLGDLGNKFAAFGWTVTKIDGHNTQQIRKALETVSERPHAVIASTTKGKGVPEMENNPAWHHAKFSEADFIRMSGL